MVDKEVDIMGRIITLPIIIIIGKTNKISTRTITIKVIGSKITKVSIVKGLHINNPIIGQAIMELLNKTCYSKMVKLLQTLHNKMLQHNSWDCSIIQINQLLLFQTNQLSSSLKHLLAI